MLNKDTIEVMADQEYSEQSLDPTDRLFVMLVDVADVYLSHVEAMMPDDQPESPFVAGTMPLDVVIEGLRENLIQRQEGRQERVE